MTKTKDYLTIRSYLRHWDGSQPVIWYSKAEYLFESAQCLRGKNLRTRLQRLECYYLMIGLVYENLLKGLIILRTHLKIPHKGGYPKPIKGHNLIVLSKTANFPFSPTEKRLLKNLQGYVEWRGKYPVPLADDGFRCFPIFPTATNDAMIDAIHRRLKRAFEDECPYIIKRKKTAIRPS